MSAADRRTSAKRVGEGREQDSNVVDVADFVGQRYVAVDLAVGAAGDEVEVPQTTFAEIAELLKRENFVSV